MKTLVLMLGELAILTMVIVGLWLLAYFRGILPEIHTVFWYKISRRKLSSPPSSFYYIKLDNVRAGLCYAAPPTRT